MLSIEMGALSLLRIATEARHIKVFRLHRDYHCGKSQRVPWLHGATGGEDGDRP
jgi:hypothetical protein